MDIQIPATPEKAPRNTFQTPPRSNRQQEEYCSPPPKHNYYQTPPKKKVLFETPKKTPFRNNHQEDTLFSGVKPKENPESKKNRGSAFRMKESSPMREESEETSVTPFQLSRMEQDYSLVQHLGGGNFSEVGLYKSRFTGELFAIKIAKANSMSVNEVQALGSLWVLAGQCPHVVRYYHSWVEEGQLFLVMEYCQGHLQKQIMKHRKSSEPIPQKMIINYLRAALMGLASIHKYGILHLDVKPQNMLFKGNVLKIADFGLSRAAKMNGEIEEGDSRYMARQVLNPNSSVDLTKADIYSLAMTAYEMLTLQVLPNNGEKWMRMREEGVKVADRMDLTNYSERLLKTVERMGASSWQNRPAASELLKEPLFKQSSRVSNLLQGPTFKSGKKRQQSSL